MSYSRDYPKSVREILNESLNFEQAVIACVRRFARSKPWRGTFAERREKFRRFHVACAEASGVNPPRLVFAGPADPDSTRSCYVRALDTIVLRGPLSVVTFLHEWGHRLHGPSEVEACRWSVNLFRVGFPKSWARARFDGHLIRRSRD